MQTARPPVSIPFIAGQWSLRRVDAPGGVPPGAFQSPSLRGSGRFQSVQCRLDEVGRFQSPSLRGSGRFGRVPDIPVHQAESFNPLHCGAVVASVICDQVRFERVLVSIPFIAGQWSLPAEADDGAVVDAMFQSPSLRGSGRFGSRLDCGVGAGRRFQSPSLRGSGRFEALARNRDSEARRFNPLHCGAVVASKENK